MKFSFDKQKFILISTKYLAYLINLGIVIAVLSGISMWIYLLYKSAQ